VRLVVGRGYRDVKILTDSGEDITAELGVTHLRLDVEPEGYPTVQMDCLGWLVDVEVPAERVAATVIHQEPEQNTE